VCAPALVLTCIHAFVSTVRTPVTY
jgi:hypothetical protein